ncbi:hypothetical protein [Bifidobacterium commune]|uniref:hypothetical protein n=1 Tax=Bifidobacterium commune TaxID=1505727 RepID=UPI00190BD0CE|nr:hypothetical protein [Bifidobacterium commune]
MEILFDDRGVFVSFAAMYARCSSASFGGVSDGSNGGGFGGCSGGGSFGGG